jgi:hypothetical protein
MIQRALLVVMLIAQCPSVFGFVPIHLNAHHTPTCRITGAGATEANIPLDARITMSPVHRLMVTNNSDNEIEEGGDLDAKKNIRDEIFWAKQRALAAEMAAKSDASLRAEQQSKFAQRRLALTSDTFYFSILIGSLLWLISSNPFVTISYLFGALSGTAYSYGLGKYVESIGGSIDDEGVEGAGVGQARFAFLILLFVVVGKFRSQGLLEIPSIMGFFTYQLASLSQGLREIDD